MYYKEININFVYKRIIRRNIFFSNIKFFQNLNLNLSSLLFIYNKFVFKKVVDLMLLRIFKHYLLLWFLLNKKFYLKNYKSVFVKGVRYYNFLIKLNLNKNIEKCEFINFLIEQVFVNLDNIGLKFIFFKNKCDVLVKDLDMFTNLRLSNNVYLFFIKDLLYIKFGLKNKLILKLNKLNSLFDLKLLLNYLKIY